MYGYVAKVDIGNYGDHTTSTFSKYLYSGRKEVGVSKNSSLCMPNDPFDDWIATAIISFDCIILLSN